MKLIKLGFASIITGGLALSFGTAVSSESESTPGPVYVQDSADAALERTRDVPDFVPPEPKKSPVEPQAIELCPTTAYDNPQEVIDTGVLGLYKFGDAEFIGGHNNEGWDWIDTLEPGTLVEVTCGPAEGTYEAYDNDWQEGLEVPEWVWDGPDLVLQTCTGLNGEPKGIGFTLLKEVS